MLTPYFSNIGKQVNPTCPDGIGENILKKSKTSAERKRLQHKSKKTSPRTPHGNISKAKSKIIKTLHPAAATLELEQTANSSQMNGAFPMFASTAWSNMGRWIRSVRLSRIMSPNIESDIGIQVVAAPLNQVAVATPMNAPVGTYRARAAESERSAREIEQYAKELLKREKESAGFNRKSLSGKDPLFRNYIAPRLSNLVKISESHKIWDDLADGLEIMKGAKAVRKSMLGMKSVSPSAFRQSKTFGRASLAKPWDSMRPETTRGPGDGNQLISASVHTGDQGISSRGVKSQIVKLSDGMMHQSR